MVLFTFLICFIIQIFIYLNSTGLLKDKRQRGREGLLCALTVKYLVLMNLNVGRAFAHTASPNSGVLDECYASLNIRVGRAGRPNSFRILGTKMAESL